MPYYIIHKYDTTYDPWNAGSYENAKRLLEAILEEKPELVNKLEIVTSSIRI